MGEGLHAPQSLPTAPPAFGPTPTYLWSSQARHWRFSPRQLEKRRQEGNAGARARLADAWQRERTASAVPDEPASSSSSDPISFLSVEDEVALVTYYLTRVRGVIKAFEMPEVVEATAITYIKRFYLINTCMDWHPKNVMITCLFLAAKAENCPISLSHFSSKLAGKEPTQAAIDEYVKLVREHEFMVSQSLEFEYMVHGAHRALHGLFLDFQQTVCKPEDLKPLLAPAQANLRLSRLTDAELIFTPSQIALSCVRAASAEGKDLVKNFLDVKEKRATDVAVKGKAEREAWRQAELERQKRKPGAAEVNASKKKEEEEQSQPTGSNAQDAVDLDADEGKEDKKEEIVEYGDAEIRAKPLGATRAEIEQVLDDIERLFRAREALDASQERITATEIDKRLKACQNPEKTAGTRLHQLALQKATTNPAGSSKKRKAKVEEKDPFDDDDDDDENVPATFGPQGKKVKVEALEGNLFKEDIEKGRAAKEL